VTEDADIKSLAVERDADICLIGRGLTFVWLGLNEVGRRFRRVPDRLVEGAVESNRRARFHGGHQPAAVGRLQLKLASLGDATHTGPSFNRGRNSAGEEETNKKPQPAAGAVTKRGSSGVSSRIHYRAAPLSRPETAVEGLF
jgi:hypothetical protein